MGSDVSVDFGSEATYNLWKSMSSDKQTAWMTKYNETRAAATLEEARLRFETAKADEAESTWGSMFNVIRDEIVDAEELLETEIGSRVAFNYLDNKCKVESLLSAQ